MVKTSISYQKILGIRHTSKICFYLSFKSIPDAILIPRSLSPPYEYIEGGDFRDTLNNNSNISNLRAFNFKKALKKNIFKSFESLNMSMR